MKQARIIPMERTQHELKTKTRIFVCVIEQNDLAMNFIDQIINADHAIIKIGIPDLPKLTAESAEKCVFILDDCGLMPPIHAYLKRLKRNYQNAKYIVLAKEVSFAYVSELIALGIDGFLSYNELVPALLSAIKAVSANKLWIKQEIQQHYIKNGLHAVTAKDSNSQTLTAREREIVHLVRQRFNNEDIANLLEVRESTVKFHLSNIFLKLQVKSRRDIVGKRLPSSWDQIGA